MANPNVGVGAFASGMAGGMNLGMSVRDKIDREEAAKAEELRRATEQQTAQDQQDLADKLEQQKNQSQQQGMGIDPSMMSQFASQGAAGGNAGTALSGGSAAGGSGTGAMGMPTGFGAYAGGGSAASGGSSSLASGAAAAGPWAGLAAIIAVNEKSARNGGYRRDGSQYAKDLLGGKVVEQDLNQRFVPKVLGNNDKTHLGKDAEAIGEFTTLDFKNGFKKMGDGAVPNLIKKLF